MNQLEQNINSLKEFVTKRETYVRFSPLWTAITWVIFIIYYIFIKNNFININSLLWIKNWDFLLFLILWIFSFIIVTIFSILNSEKRKEKLLPKSIQFILGNIFHLSLFYLFLVIFFFEKWKNELFFWISFTFYWILILISRYNIPKYLKYFWYFTFYIWIIFLYSLLWDNIISNYYYEIILLLFWIWHLFMAYLLKKDNG